MNPVEQIISIVYKGEEYRLAAKLRRTSSDYVVFIHGWGAVKEGFDAAFASEALRDFSICTFDLLGYGGSDKPVGFSYTMEDHAEITKLLIRALKAERVHLVGHSMGGLVGLLCVAGLGSTLESFTTVEGNLVPEDAGRNIHLLVNQPYWAFKGVGYGVYRLLMKHSADRMTRIWGSWWDAASPEAIYKNAQSIIVWSDSGKLPAMFRSAPRGRYIVGETSNKKAAILSIDESAAVEIPDSGHFMILENPEAFYDAVAATSKGGV